MGVLSEESLRAGGEADMFSEHKSTAAGMRQPHTAVQVWPSWSESSYAQDNPGTLLDNSLRTSQQSGLVAMQATRHEAA